MVKDIVKLHGPKIVFPTEKHNCTPYRDTFLKPLSKDFCKNLSENKGN